MGNYLVLSIAVLMTACASTPTNNAPSVLTSAVPSTSSASTNLQSMKGMLEAHNQVRQQHNLPLLSWSVRLATHAKEWAHHLAKNNACRLQHRSEAGRDQKKYGENLYWGGPLIWSDGRQEVQEISAADVAQSWASEKVDYTYQSNSCRRGKQCGHYTQMVWKDTTQVGCGAALCPDRGQIWACNYNPAGNWIGQSPY